MNTIFRRALPAAALLLLASCTDSVTPAATPPATKLQDLVASNLPSPYYHFEYDSTGRVKTVSFASGLRNYEVVYDGSRIAQMNNTTGSQEHLDYVYDDAGHVSLVKYVDSTGQVFALVSFFYVGPRLAKLERDRRVTGGFIIDKTMTFAYYPDGNLELLSEHRPPVDSLQAESTHEIRYERYDDKINVDGFSLIHDDFFDHLVLLPDVQFQKHNAARELLTGDGLNTDVDYTYTYDSQNRPLSKAGTATVRYGSDTITVVQIRTDYTYYR